MFGFFAFGAGYYGAGPLYKYGVPAPAVSSSDDLQAHEVETLVVAPHTASHGATGAVEAETVALSQGAPGYVNLTSSDIETIAL